MSSYTDNSLWDKERLFLEGERIKFPEKFQIKKETHGSLLKRVGITEGFSELPLGYVKYSPYDFIVEEILEDGTVITADMDESVLSPSLVGEGTVYVDIVKVGISTLDAIDRIALALSIDKKAIGYAGIKDAVALTAQRLSIRGVDIEAVKGLSIPGVIIKNIRQGKGAISVGSLRGNRFTLFIRTKSAFDTNIFLSRIQKIKEDGVMNYYGPQRFGSPRFLSHLFGLYILQGDIMGLLRSFFGDESPFEWIYVRELRREAIKHFGDWKVMSDIFSKLPYTFRLETELLFALKSSVGPSGYISAMKSIQKQIEIWPKSYASYLANKVLSDMKDGKTPLTPRIPLLISNLGAKDSMYTDYLNRDGVPSDFLKNVRKFPFLHVGESSFINSKIRPDIIGTSVSSSGVTLSFDLEKGAYATTILMNIFDTMGEIPVPDWVNADFFDTKKILKSGSLESIKEYFDPLVKNILKERGGELE